MQVALVKQFEAKTLENLYGGVELLILCCKKYIILKNKSCYISYSIFLYQVEFRVPTS